MQEASREILWNVNSSLNTIIMYSLFGISLLIACNGIILRALSWLSGQSSPRHTGKYIERVYSLWKNAFLQKGVIREKSIAVAHSLIYLGFIVLTFTTTMVMIDHDLGFKIYHGNFYLIITVFSDIFGAAVIFGCAIIAHRRYIQTNDRLHNRPLDSLFLTSIVVLCLQGFILEGLRIHVTNDPWSAYSPIGLIFAKCFWFLSLPASKLLHFYMWWFHAISVFAAFAIFPYSKFFHILSSSLNLYFKDHSQAGRLSHPGDLMQKLEAGEDFSIGINTIKDYSWKMLLDLDACTSCGRCQSVCPAYNSGKVLSPKWLILDIRNHALLSNAKVYSKNLLTKFLCFLDQFFIKNLLLKASGVIFNESSKAKIKGEFRSKNTKVQNSAISLGNPDARIAGEVLDPNVFWSCTTCYACVEACPVGINHVEQIIDNRRNMVLMHGELPSEARQSLQAIETRSNPYGAAEDRGKWHQDLEIKILAPGDEVEYLYWVGCISAYDTRKQKIAKSLTKIFNSSGISWGILGNRECCTGDPARRLGEELLFQNLAKQNVASLAEVKFSKIVANCPHCFNSLKNDYFELTNKKFEVVHHSQLIQDLLNNGKIKVKNKSAEYTFHDPCYLGRYNKEYEAPRSGIKKISGLKIIEMEQNKEKAMCCGAGGGHFWFDLKEGERINTLRVEQACQTGTNKIATACPFCLQMLEDGAKLLNKSDLEVRDIAEIIAENLA